MDWMEQIDIYCERTDFSYWSEPVNALTNAAFLIAAAYVWPRTKGAPLARLLAVILAAIGVGSYLFHTHATAWAATADTTPILLYILVYIYAANRQFWGLGWPLAALGAAGFVPLTIVATPLIERLPFFGISAFYWPVPMLIAAYAVALRHRRPETARGLAIGAGILCASLVFRSLDMGVCEALPLGTHFMWHILNGVMLGWMILVYLGDLRRSRALEGRAARG
ncbi:ceramidase domain-containing protein [Histidinibacterium lentulum]|uniref:Ceramidase n=1 Tax=Histidinibacterium lentulum TaxID=2480588 RepID=A0A3N2R7M1_9RHOB|nr:ceramidase domain-containing protein [Histidinibacterium lentulum]ROU03454.1 hypothetical protein EAT49_03910 [Histidinibacterium lentulum]